MLILDGFVWITSPKIDDKEDKVTKHQQICGSYSTPLWAIDHFRWMWYLPPQVDSLAAGPSSAWARPIRYLGGLPTVQHTSCKTPLWFESASCWSQNPEAARLDLVTLSPCAKHPAASTHTPWVSPWSCVAGNDHRTATAPHLSMIFLVQSPKW